VFAKKEKKEDLDRFGGRIDALERVLNSKKIKKWGKAPARKHIAPRPARSSGNSSLSPG
jgi:hypothetical protein